MNQFRFRLNLIMNSRNSVQTEWTMSLWKVMSLGSAAARQGVALERQAGRFVWGSEGFKWISGEGGVGVGQVAGQQVELQARSSPLVAGTKAGCGQSEFEAAVDMDSLKKDTFERY